MEMRVERAVVLILCNLQSPHRTEETVALEADTSNFVVSREKPYHISELLICVIYGREKLIGHGVRPGKDNVIDVIEPCERVEERRVFVFALDCLSVAAVVAKAASAKIRALDVLYVLKTVIIHVPQFTAALYSICPARECFVLCFVIQLHVIVRDNVIFLDTPGDLAEFVFCIEF